VGVGDPEIGEQHRHRLRGHRRPPVGVQVAALDPLALAALRDQALGEPHRLAMSRAPRS